MKKIFIFLFLFLCIGTCFAGNSTVQTEDIPYVISDNNDTIQAIEGGDSDIQFQDGYKGYCIEYMEKSAEPNDTFYVANTSYIKNKQDNDVSNYIKVFFVHFYDNTQNNNLTYRDEPVNQLIYNQHIIWHFTDNFTSPVTQQSQDLLQSIRHIADKEYVHDVGEKPYNNTTKMIYDFKAFISVFENHQNYFGYKINFTPIDNSINNTTTPNDTTVIDNITTPNDTATTNNTTSDHIIIIDKINQSYNFAQNNHTPSITLHNPIFSLNDYQTGNKLLILIVAIWLTGLGLIYLRYK